MRPVFLDSRGADRQVQPRKRVNAAQSCMHSISKQRSTSRDCEIHVSQNRCDFCKHKNNIYTIKRVVWLIVAVLFFSIVAITFLDAASQEAQAARRVSDACELEYNISRVGDAQ